MKWMGIALTVGLIGSAQAADTWVHITGNAQVEVSLKYGSCSYQEDGIVCVERMRMLKNNFVYFHFVKTTAVACKQGFGRITNISLEGREESYDDAVANGRSLASDEFDILCTYFHTGEKT